MDTKTKKLISQRRKATKTKRGEQVCKVFEVKVDRSHLSAKTEKKLERLFLEAKWLYNYYLANDPLKVHWNQKQVQVKIKDIFETRDINVTGAHIKQSILQNIKQSMLNLSKAKKKGIKIGRLKYKSEINTLNLKESPKEDGKGTYRIKGNRIKAQNMPYLRVVGLKQLKGYELANAQLLRRAGDYYFYITCYKDKEEKLPAPCGPVGVDFGLNHQLTLSNGVSIDYQAPRPKGLRNKYQKHSKKQKGSKNRYKAQIKIQKTFQHWNNQKKDTTNKINKILKDTFSIICYQNDNIKGWQKLWGSKMLSISLGGITSKLKGLETSIEVDMFYASTKICSQCHNEKNEMPLAERVYRCEACNLIIDRDLNAAINILREGLKQIGGDTIDFKPVETEASVFISLLEQLNAVPRVECKHLSVKQETSNTRVEVYHKRHIDGIEQGQALIEEK